jgi:mannose-1-phosphate guanylyltransferase
MKAFLLAGGLGTRLRPLTDHLPKCLLPIRGTPMLQIWFQLFYQYGIDEVLINVHSHGDAVRRFLERSENGFQVRLFTETTLLGSAGTVLANRDWIRNEGSFWIFYADVLTTTNLDRMLDFHNEHGQIATIGVYQVPDPSRCGVVQVDRGGIVRKFVEKPIQPKGNLAFTGLMVGTPELLDLIPDKDCADFGFDVLPCGCGRTAAYRVRDFLIDVGTPENYRKAQLAWPGLPQFQNTR